MEHSSDYNDNKHHTLTSAEDTTLTAAEDTTLTAAEDTTTIAINDATLSAADDAASTALNDNTEDMCPENVLPSVERKNFHDKKVTLHVYIDCV